MYLIIFSRETIPEYLQITSYNYKRYVPALYLFSATFIYFLTAAISTTYEISNQPNERRLIWCISYKTNNGMLNMRDKATPKSYTWQNFVPAALWIPG